jgi:RNA polymerase sigma-70 factor (ECF subfamily)
LFNELLALAWTDGYHGMLPCRVVARAYDRLRQLARTIFHQDFPRLEGIHETGSILNELALRLLRSLRQARPATPRAFFAYASSQIRYILIDFARRHDQRAAANDQQLRKAATEPVDPEGEAADLVIWTEFHEAVEHLPEEEREVVNLHFYQGLTQAETAQLLGIHDRAVSRRWLHALAKLSASLPGWDCFFKERKLPYDAQSQA